MTGTPVQDAGTEAELLADMASLTPEPRHLAAMLTRLGYLVSRTVDGLRAERQDGATTLAMALPLYSGSGLVIRRNQVIGPRVARCAALVALLGALRAVASDRRPGTLLLLDHPAANPFPGRCITIEGGVVPKIWPRCFGSFSLLIRIFGRLADPGMPGVALNPIEEAVPVLQALIRLKGTVVSHGSPRQQLPDSPLQPRLSIVAAHGGSADVGLPAMFDILVNRRYDPSEDPNDAQAEIEQTARAACRPEIHLSTSMIDHLHPRPDPEAGTRTLASQALAVGWEWPQVPFRTTPSLVPGSTLLGGLDRSDVNPDSDTAHTSLGDVTALMRAAIYLLNGWTADV